MVRTNDVDRLNKAGPDVRSPRKGASEKKAIDYGIGQDAEFAPGREETESQEYEADGLPRTGKYAVDKTARKDHADYGF